MNTPDEHVAQPTLRLYDSAQRAVVPLAPTVTPGVVTIYLCGATVQGSPHIGHMRSAIAFDVLRRWLTRQGQRVIMARNVTDIDDKILTKSAATEPPTPWWAHAQHFEREFAAAYEALGVIPPTVEPRATGHIPEQIALIERLMERGHAYVGSPGNVYFSVSSLPDYGSLTNQRVSDLATTEDESQIDAAVEADKRDPRDFALWKAAKPTEPADAAWESPWGRGRPGWHLECSAMSQRYLGDTFDIHGGGIDLRFPHHENEQAQSHGAGWGFANHWVHNAWVTIKGEKMSKSLGNSLVVSELLTRYPAYALRAALGTVHHRSTVEFSDETLTEAAAMFERFAATLLRAHEVLTASLAPNAPEGVDGVDAPEDFVRTYPLPEDFSHAMDDDLNLAGALAQIHQTIKALNAELAGANPDAGRVWDLALSARAMLEILGLDPLAQPWRATVMSGTGADGQNGAMDALGSLVQAMLDERAQARQDRDWARADALRDQLTHAGVVVEDSPTGARWHLA
ncbi:cysteine--tRNA ligase [Actinomyces vulturis]|uniref:cysteine--tRNA ligase n=1 Tax=Actinomyces vulturis TaxID=1857645 RepID=UPI00082FD713|nr:cysteine--tRNA ligase [Actinomyces vulturis]